MTNFDVLLFKSSNKYQTPEKHELSSLTKLSISENDFVYLEIKSNERFNNDTFVWLSDYRFSLTFERKDKDYYHYSIVIHDLFRSGELEKFSHRFKVESGERLFYKIFLNFYGLCEIEIERVFLNETRYEKIAFIEIISNKINDVDYLLEYLFEKEFFFWESISLTKNTAAEKEKISENILWRLISIKNIYSNSMDNLLQNIHFDKFYKLLPVEKIMSWEAAENITENSALWLTQNINLLEISNSYADDHFLILNRPFRTKTILAESLYKDTNVYENQLVHWFVNEINRFLNDSLQLINVKYEEYLAKGDLNFKHHIYQRYFKRLQGLIIELNSSFQSIKLILNEELPVKREEIGLFETQRIESKLHYFDVYLDIVKWIENKQVNHFPDLLFSGLKDVSKLYEIYCLFKISDTLITDLEFRSTYDKISSNPSQFTLEDYFANKTEIASTYNFEDDELLITLYYELLPVSLTSVAKIGNREFKPDFILEVTTKKDEEKHYIILDAKYKNIGNIESYDYQDLCLKYLHGIGPKKGGRFNVLGLIIINPIAESKISFFQRSNYDLDGGFRSLPIIGRVEVGVEKIQINYLANLLKRFFSILLK